VRVATLSPLVVPEKLCVWSLLEPLVVPGEKTGATPPDTGKVVAAALVALALFLKSGWATFSGNRSRKGDPFGRGLWSCSCAVCFHAVAVIPVAAKLFAGLARLVHELIVRIWKAPGRAHAATGA